MWTSSALPNGPLPEACVPIRHSFRHWHPPRVSFRYQSSGEYSDCMIFSVVTRSLTKDHPSFIDWRDA